MAKPITAAELARITAIEKRKGPVGKGHHNSHRTAAILKWLRNHNASPTSGDKLTPGDTVDPNKPAKGKFVPFTKGK